MTSDRKVTIATLEAFADAWNRHAIDDLMSFMADDCVFEANAGPDVSGTVYRGREEVRRGFMRAWQLFPDARWNGARHFVSGDRGCSEWVFTGTGADGLAVEVAGCDVFQFEGDKITVKNSFRKQRS
ncbi:nuclear transport factor 2 family protein [uncultured Bradyrhizobium sp.]|uniref:nuclear transport factor 2 family protein n=1 Tax=Bradyrhizobium sp. TaxID=376 RepID=UPI00261CB5F2|nr:nuclear transport factor 2 family protein [uncultured Bradyrhizobium sp.]